MARSRLAKVFIYIPATGHGFKIMWQLSFHLIKHPRKIWRIMLQYSPESSHKKFPCQAWEALQLMKTKDSSPAQSFGCMFHTRPTAMICVNKSSHVKHTMTKVARKHHIDAEHLEILHHGHIMRHAEVTSAHQLWLLVQNIRIRLKYTMTVLVFIRCGWIYMPSV